MESADLMDHDSLSHRVWSVIRAVRRHSLFARLWALYAVLSFLYLFTKGLALDCNGDGKQICYVRDFNDIASDDDLFLIPPGIVFGSCGMAWGLFREDKATGIADFVVYALLLLLQLMLLIMAEAAPFTSTFSDTITLTHNLVVLGWTLSYAMLWIIFIVGIFKWLGRLAGKPLGGL